MDSYILWHFGQVMFLLKKNKKQKAEAAFCEANLIGTVTKIVLVNIICFVIYIKSFHYFCIYTRLH